MMFLQVGEGLDDVGNAEGVGIMQRAAAMRGPARAEDHRGVDGLRIRSDAFSQAGGGFVNHWKDQSISHLRAEVFKIARRHDVVWENTAEFVIRALILPVVPIEPGPSFLPEPAAL